MASNWTKTPPMITVDTQSCLERCSLDKLDGFWSYWKSGETLQCVNSRIHLRMQNPSQIFENPSQGCHKFPNQPASSSGLMIQNPLNVISMDTIWLVTTGLGIGNSILGVHFWDCGWNTVQNPVLRCYKFVNQPTPNSVDIFQKPSSMISYEPIWLVTSGFRVGRALWTPRLPSRTTFLLESDWTKIWFPQGSQTVFVLFWIDFRLSEPGLVHSNRLNGHHWTEAP